MTALGRAAQPLAAAASGALALAGCELILGLDALRLADAGSGPGSDGAVADAGTDGGASSDGGGGWMSLGAPQDVYRAVWGEGTRVWAVGSNSVQRLDLQTGLWTPEVACGGTYWAIWGQAGGLTFLVGDVGAPICRRDTDGTWRVDTPTSLDSFRGVWGRGSPPEVWAVGGTGVIARRAEDGGWSEDFRWAVADAGRPLYAVSGEPGSTGDVWAVGEYDSTRPAVVSRSGGTWSGSNIAGVNGPALRAVWGGGTEAWAVGGPNVLRHRSPGGWPPFDYLLGLLAVSGEPSGIWTGGASGLWRCDANRDAGCWTDANPGQINGLWFDETGTKLYAATSTGIFRR